MPFTEQTLGQARLLASHALWDALHDPENPPKLYCQAKNYLELLRDGEDTDPFTNPGEDVSGDFEARYDPERGEWTFHATRQTRLTHALTPVWWTPTPFGGPGVPERYYPGDTFTIHIDQDATRDTIVTVTSEGGLL